MKVNLLKKNKTQLTHKYDILFVSMNKQLLTKLMTSSSLKKKKTHKKSFKNDFWIYFYPPCLQTDNIESEPTI